MGKIVIIVGIAAALIVGYYIYTQRPQPTPPINTTGTTPTIVSPITIDIPAEKVEELKMGGSSYLDKKGVYSLLYPNDYKFDEQSEGEIARIYKQGPTQRGQTEMYDGVILTFQTIDLEDLTLDKYVDKQIAEATQDGTSEITSGKKAIVINGHSGFTYTLRGLGEFPHYVIQKDETSRYAVSISILVADPQNVGFQEDVNATLSTIELHK